MAEPQTGVSDIPLTENGERMVKEMGPRMVGENSMPTNTGHDRTTKEY
jgi:broad specificity phosphatase PhoE